MFFEKISTHYIPFEAGNLKVVIKGDSGKLPLFILPGGPGFAGDRCYSYCDQFEAYAQLVYLDPPGCGESTAYPPDDGNGLMQYARAVEAARQALGYEAIQVFGISYGAMVALHYACEHSERVLRLGIVAGAPCYEFIEKARKNLADMVKSGRATTEQVQLIEPLWTGKFESDEQVQAMLTAVAPLHCLHFAGQIEKKASAIEEKSDKPALYLNRQALNAAFSSNFWEFDLRGKLGKLTMPIIAITGEADWINDPCFLEIFKESWRENSRAKVFKVPESSHMVPIDQPAFFKYVMEWLLIGVEKGNILNTAGLTFRHVPDVSAASPAYE